MKTFFFSTLFLFSTLCSFAQTEPKTSSLQVVGHGKMYVKPDLGVLIIRIHYKHLNFSQSIVGLNEKTKEMSKQIVAMGFKEEDIKTTDFQINENKVYARDRYIDSGYIASQNVQVEFKNQKETITKILSTFAKSKTDFSVNFNFKLSDTLKTKAQDELIVMAIKDAKRKSKLIGTSAEVTLKKIKEINYGTPFSGGVSELRDVRVFKAMATEAPHENISGFTPNDLLLEDSLSIVWEIE